MSRVANPSKALYFKKLVDALVPGGVCREERDRIAHMVRAYRRSPAVVKVGGSALSEQCGPMVFDNIKTLGNLGIPLVIVHGGGKEIDDAMKARGLKIERRGGQRVTDGHTIAVLKDVMPRIGHEIMKSLVDENINATHVWGHGGVLVVERMSEELGFVGNVVEVLGTHGILGFARAGIIPVITPLGYSGDQVYNINADNAAARIAVALGASGKSARRARKIIFVTNVAGILDGSNATIRDINVADLKALAGGSTISGGMIPKVEAAIYAVEGGVGASIIDGRKENSLLSHLLGYNGSGTEIHS
jgi:acetylglutamate kinase